MRIGNRVTEKDVRQWLDAQGWSGRSAKFDHLELHAIQPPGWIQVFRFRVDVVPAPQPDTYDTDVNDENDHTPQQTPHAPASTAQTRYGAVRDDERQKNSPTKIWLFNDPAEQADKLNELSEGLITLRNGKTSAGFLPLLAIFIGLATLVTSLVYWFNS